MNKSYMIAFATAAALTGVVVNTGCDKQATAAEVSATPATPVVGLNKEAADKAREHFETMWVNRGVLVRY
jgi:Pyruvate/2-oxoacid:ferredoxin oxidoreductase gamma subunit